MACFFGQEACEATFLGLALRHYFLPFAGTGGYGVRMPSASRLTRFALGACLAAFILAGGFGVYDHWKLSGKVEAVSEELASTTTSYEAQVSERNEALTAAQAQNDSLSSALTAEKKRNGDFQDQLDTLSGNIGTLTKLSQTDPQLLAKYSKVYFLNENYVPAKLSDIDPAYAFQSDRTYEFESDALPFLEDMLAAAKADGVDLKVASSYRSFGSQAALKSGYTVRYGTSAANSFSADQGYSEHQLGTAVDLTTVAVGGSFVGFDKSPAYAWLTAHAYEYGFILSYPAKNAYYVYEPWHWRFVGIKLAQDLHDENKHFYDLDQREINTYLVNLFDR